jgi:hypothetical protein
MICSNGSRPAKPPPVMLIINFELVCLSTSEEKILLPARAVLAAIRAILKLHNSLEEDPGGM